MQHTKDHRRICPLRLGWVILAFGVAAIALATLSPTGNQDIESAFSCIFCGERALADVLVNVALYVPLGIGLALVGLRPRKVVLVGAMLSAVIEVSQIALPGRDSSIGDVLSNTGGAALGIVLVMTAALWVDPTHRVSSRLTVGWALVPVTIWGITGWLLQPSFPETVYHGQWTPDFGTMERYRGRVLDVSVGEMKVPPWQVEDPAQLRASLLGGTSAVVTFVGGPAPTGISPIFSLADESHGELLLLGPDRNDLVFRYRTRSEDFGLDRPDLRIHDAESSIREGDTVSITVKRIQNGWAVKRDNGHFERLGFTIGRGWAVLFYPASLPRRLSDALDLLWIGALLFPAGYWMRRASASIAGITICLLGAAVIPRLFGLLGTPARIWIAVSLGILAGAAVRRLLSVTADAHAAASR